MLLYIMAFHFTLLYSPTSTNGHRSTTATSPHLPPFPRWPLRGLTVFWICIHPTVNLDWQGGIGIPDLVIRTKQAHELFLTLLCPPPIAVTFDFVFIPPLFPFSPFFSGKGWLDTEQSSYCFIVLILGILLFAPKTISQCVVAFPLFHRNMRRLNLLSTMEDDKLWLYYYHDLI